MTEINLMIACQDARRKGYTHLAASYAEMMQQNREREALRIRRQADIEAERFTEAQRGRQPRVNPHD